MKLKTTTTVDPSIRLQFLIERHQALDDEADELQTRSYLSPYDRDRLKLVKVMRLKAKEAVEKFRREIGRNDNIHVN
tara:strand:- start:325 stop:555 length:231 start_codon:yes stop_codon:yes gene_type:complete